VLESTTSGWLLFNRGGKVLSKNESIEIYYAAETAMSHFFYPSRTSLPIDLLNASGNVSHQA
jgi:hypothetical protein